MKLEPTVRLRGLVPVFSGTLTVVLILVFFILLSTSFLLQPGVAVDLPASRFLLPAMQDPLIVAVTAAPRAAIYFEDRMVKPELLGGRFDERRMASTHVVIMADERAPLRIVAEVTQLALDRGFSVALATTRQTKP
jgi:biopolymer transport protein ExbD